MIKKVIFYLIETPLNDAFKPLESHEKVACDKILENWQQGLSIFIACEDQAQAERIDEYLWQLPTEHFIPHNLVGEGMRGGSPIEIGWKGKRGSSRRQLLINLQHHFPEFATVYSDIIDFVPLETELKELARERYKTYKNVGYHLKTIKI